MSEKLVKVLVPAKFSGTWPQFR